MPPYHPQKEYGSRPYNAGRGKKTDNYGAFENTPTINTDGSRYPKTVLRFNQEKGYQRTVTSTVYELSGDAPASVRNEIETLLSK